MKIKPFKQGADFEHLRKVLMRETTKGPVPILELFVDVDVMAEITGMDIPIDKATEFIRNFGWSNDPEVVLAGTKIMDLSLDFRSVRDILFFHCLVRDFECCRCE
jgi:hypothetical protein